MNASQESLLPEDDSIFHDLSGRADNISIDAIVEDSFAEELPQPRCQSTPSSKQPPPSSTRQSPRLRARALSPALVAPQSPKSPARPAPANPRAIKGRGKKDSAALSKAGRIKCPKCPNTFANKKTLHTHLRTHVLKGVTSKAPTLQDLLQAMERLVRESLKVILEERVIGELSRAVHDYSEKLLSSVFSDVHCEIKDELLNLLSEKYFTFIENKKILFPSSIRNSFYCGTNQLLSASEFTEALKGNLLAFEDCSSEVLNVFVGNFMLTLCNLILVFSIKHMRSVTCENVCKTVYQKRSTDSVSSPEFRQLVYHIGGSIVNGFLWKGRIYSKNSQTWTTFCITLKKMFLINESKTNQCSEEVRSFSEKKGQRGL